MRMLDVEGRLAGWYQSSVSEGGPAILLRSKPGRGKTSVLQLAPQKIKTIYPQRNFGFSLINGANFTLMTATGYMWPKEIDGKQYSTFTRPYWWFTKEGKPLEAYDGGVILIDEEDKLGLDEKKIVGEAALSKVMGNHKLPPGWVVWFAGNFVTDRSGSTKELDHLIARRLTLHVKDDLESLLNWMDRNEALPETKTFAEENSNIVFQDAPKEQGPWCTPRTLMYVDTHIKAMMNVGKLARIPVDPLMHEEISAAIGVGAAAQYINAVILGNELPAYGAIIADPTRTPIPAKPDAMRLAMYRMANLVSAKDMAQVITYIDRCPASFAMVFGRATIKRDMKLVLHPAYAKWSQKHAALIALINSIK